MFSTLGFPIALKLAHLRFVEVQGFELDVKTSKERCVSREEVGNVCEEWAKEWHADEYAKFSINRLMASILILMSLLPPTLRECCEQWVARRDQVA